MAKINTIDSLSMSAQRAIKKWYTYSVYIVTLIVLILFGTTGAHLYYASTNQACTPRINQLYTNSLQQKHNSLISQKKKAKLLVSLQEKGKKHIEQYTSVLLAHIQKPTLLNITDLYLSPSGITALYTINSLTSVQACIHDLNTIPNIAATIFESLDQQNIKTRGATCTIKATWK